MSESSSVALVVSHCPDVGPACARSLVRDGLRTTLAGAVGEQAPAVEGMRVLAGSDVTSEAGIDAAFQQVEDADGPVDVVVVVTGHGESQPLLRSDQATFEVELGQHLTAAFLCTRRAVPAMVRARQGTFVFVGSVWGLYGASHRSAHAAASAGLVGLSRSLARELGSRGINANVVAPGLVETTHVREVLEGAPRIAAGIGAIRDRSALGRIGTVEDVADAAAFLASPGARFMTGVVLPVDGGLAMGFA